jgi:hypothetical protein
MVDRITIPCNRAVGKSDASCEHSENGLPYGYPMFRCAWPGCPLGVEAEYWTVGYGPHGGKIKSDEFEREKFIDEDGIVTFSWKKRV